LVVTENINPANDILSESKMNEKTILITGSSDGIGKQAALELAAMGVRVILHGRSKPRVQQAVKQIERETGNRQLDFCIADLSSLHQVRTMAAEIRRNYNRLDVLINNAGLATNRLEISDDGYEMTFAVNYLAAFALTQLLLDLLTQNPPGRIVNVSSMVHSADLDFDNLVEPKHFDGWQAYCQSKLCILLFTFELAERLRDQGVTVNCLHPGVINTKLLRVNFSGGSPVTEGADKLLYLAATPEPGATTGVYFSGNRQTRPAAIAFDTETRQKLWDLSEKLCGIDQTAGKRLA
jgi:NAD(P)-dependent dehydrogenase (short-subunit alcohol dehydrogenase family)